MEFVYIQNKLNKTQRDYLASFSGYLQTPFYFFGSILRPDYVSGLSDIDVDVFTDNEYTTMAQMLNYLNIPRQKVQNIMWITQNGTTTIGYKIHHQSGKFHFEYSIYNSQFQDAVLEEHRSKMNLPIYATLCLHILKVLHYRLHLISSKNYSQTKRYILSTGIGLPEDKFIAY